MSISPGQVWENTFPTFHPTSREQTDADSLPVGTLVKNGVDTAETVTVTKTATGLYVASVTIPSSYQHGDNVEIKIAATVAGQSATEPIARGIVIQTGLGAGMYPITVTIRAADSQTIEGVDVVLTTDSGSSASNVVASGQTNVSGQIVFYLDSGTFYVWRQKTGWNFTSQPRSLSVSYVPPGPAAVIGNSITDGTAAASTAPSEIDAETTVEELIDIYQENAGYREANSETQAVAFIHACRALLLRLPEQTKAGGGETRFSPKLIKQELDAAVAWRELVSETAPTSVRSVAKYFDASNFRD